MNDNKLLVSFSPHIRDELQTSAVMMHVVYAMLPALFVSIYFFGFFAVKTYLTAIISTLLFEYLFQKIRGVEVTINDNSALVTAILIAMNLPPSSPWWLTVTGSFVAMVIGKHVYGGLGHNPFNPALVARVFLLMAWPAQMTSWIKPNPVTNGLSFDAVTAATPLGIAKTEAATYGKITSDIGTLSDMLIGNIPGSLGEISAAALLIGGLYLLYKKIITWHIPLSFTIGFLLIITPYWLIFPEKSLNPLVHILTGGFMLGIFFMATDMVTSPVTKKGQIMFGIGCGLLTAVIRLFGGYPEGVSFAILIMNAFVPLIDYYIRPVSFGEVKK